MAHNKRDSAAADLPWPTRAPRFTETDDDDMSIPAFVTTRESASHGEPAPSASYTSSPAYAPPFQTAAPLEDAPLSQTYNYAQFGNDRTVHTITFKLWNPNSTTSRELFVQETRADGITKSYDPEHFFYKLLGHQDQANHIADYWRSFYHVPLRNTNPAEVHTLFTDPPAAPPQPAPPSLETFTTGDMAVGLWTKLFGDGGPFNTENVTDEASWPATELSEDERISLQHCLLKLGTPIPSSPPRAPGDS